MSISALKKYIKLNHGSLAIILKLVYSRFRRLPFTYEWKKHRWINNAYTKFGNDQREYIFKSIAHFCITNRPIPGYYFEFGCHGANTISMAWKNFKYLFDFKYVAFDSFEGLPTIDKIDEQLIWEKGKLMTTEEDFLKKISSIGIPNDKIITVKGFYEDSLNEDLQKKLLPTKAAVIYVDCDLYKSTVPVLDFIIPFLQTGTIIVFDDWNCFFGDPDRGERRAFREFSDKYPNIIFEPFISTNEAQAFICLES